MSGSTYSYLLKDGRTKKWGFAVYIGPKRWDEEKQRYTRQQLRREGFARQKDAQAALQEEQHQISVGSAPTLEDRRMTVEQWSAKWLASRAKIRPSTRRAYQVILDSYVNRAIGEIPVTQLRADHLDDMLAAIRSGRIRPRTARRREGGQLSAQTIRQIMAVTTAMLNGAVRRRLIPFSPATAVELEAPERHEVTVWGPQEVTTFLAFAEQQEENEALPHFSGPRLAIAWRLAFSYGLRRGEIAGLRWSDLDGDMLQVRQQLTETSGELATGPPKTTAGTRDIPLDSDPGFSAALSSHRRRQLQDRMAAPNWTETGLILAMPDGKPVPLWRLSTTFTALVAAAGLPPLRLHGCRHTCNSLWNQAGVPTFERQSWLGHSSPSMTDQLYLHLRPEQHDRAAAQVAAWREAQ
jgi:integrase